MERGDAEKVSRYAIEFLDREVAVSRTEESVASLAVHMASHWSSIHSLGLAKRRYKRDNGPDLGCA